eukprot:GHUV01019632.1.p1 GENE.GHUV01019632.1~~GHUV01019632.1.p1  ORF type:complete len:140 (+),score=23.29 GHUV01019632.1:251-670(+)
MAYRGEYDVYERDFGIVPDIVKQFVVYLYRHIRERNIPEIESMYDVSFPKLSERYFKQASWPSVDAISDLVDQDHVFCLLYKVCNASVGFHLPALASSSKPGDSTCSNSGGWRAAARPVTAAACWAHILAGQFAECLVS